MVALSMKTRGLVTGKMDNIAACQGSFCFTSNASSVTLLKSVRLADNNSSDYEPYNFSASFNSPLAIVTLLLLSLFFSIGFLSIFFRRRSTSRANSRVTRRPGADGIWEVIRWAPTQGLEPKVIESFPVFSYSLVKELKAQANFSECAVCLSDFVADEMLRLLPKCSHAFHPECIDKWLCTHTTCPVCRGSLLFTGDSISTGTDFGLLEPQAPPEVVTIVINNGAGVILRGDISNDEATNAAPGVDSMGQSLVRVRKEMEQPTEWYIATAKGLMPGSYRSCSFIDLHHSEQPSCSNAPPACFMPGDADHRSKSERWGRISMNPASVIRTCSERFFPRS